jgi:hypothetical protein
MFLIHNSFKLKTPQLSYDGSCGGSTTISFDGSGFGSCPDLIVSMVITLMPKRMALPIAAIAAVRLMKLKSRKILAQG